MEKTWSVFVLWFSVSGFAAVSPADIAAQIKSWKEEGAREGWTFEVGETPLMHIPEKFRTGYDPSVNAESLREIPHISPKPVRRPAKWDWRDSNVVSPVKDQAYPQYCGSCWAFGTVAVFESIIKIATGKDVDIAEQQLVSCTPQYGTCSGGNFAFGFYTKKGANHEADFPYQAANVVCNTTAPQMEKISRYSYVGAGAHPTLEEMKQAIYQYGPIAVTVSASGAWNGYKSGIYNACNSNGINHIVAIVGYDDFDQVWILKNSHGTQWGEQGYMRIKYVGSTGYKCNSIGDEAMFAEYKADGPTR